MGTGTGRSAGVIRVEINDGRVHGRWNAIGAIDIVVRASRIGLGKATTPDG